MAQRSTVHQLTISLAGSEPPIWRRILVPGNITLERLHHVLQSVMGWQNCHLHSFEIGERTYGNDFGESWGRKIYDEQAARLNELVLPGTSFVYLYDFGDNWEHDIEVGEITVAEPDGLYPVCVDGDGACPPEDCGGIWGYRDLLEILADPEHEEHASMTEWLGGPIRRRTIRHRASQQGAFAAAGPSPPPQEGFRTLMPGS